MATPIEANHAVFDGDAVVAATGGRLVRGTGSRAARGITSDSRAVVAGGAFVALKGERHDGHAFLGAAVEAGATLLVVERGRAPAQTTADVVEVDDTLVGWGNLGRAHFAVWRAASPGARVVAITGSAGKTTTKELCAALLRDVGETHATPGNLNNRVGVPAVLLQLEPRHRFAVLEVGMSVPGEIAILGALVTPDVAVVTNVGMAHAGGVGGTLDDVAREKGALFAAVPAAGKCVANADDAAVMAQTSRTADGVDVVTFGRRKDAVYRLFDRQAVGLEGSRLTVVRPVGSGIARRPATERVLLPIPGEAAAIDLVAAMAAAEAAADRDIDPGPALSHLAPVAGRMQVRRARGVVVLDDAYNANPASMRAALRTLGECNVARRVAVLGEMKELGPASEREHEALGEAVAEAGVALLVSCGGLADRIAERAGALGVEVALARDADAAARVVLEQARAGDVVLVKASRSVGAERVVEALLAAGEEAR